VLRTISTEVVFLNTRHSGGMGVANPQYKKKSTLVEKLIFENLIGI